MNPIMNRRAVLAGMGAASVGSTVGAATAAPQSDENPDLLKAWADFKAALVAFDKASEAKSSSIAHFNAMAPAIPDELRCINSTTLAGGHKAPGYIAERLQDADGKDIHDHRRSFMWVVDTHQLSLTLGWLDGRHSTTRRLKALLPLARRFEEARAAALDAAGVATAREAFWRADNKLRTAVTDVSDAKALTVKGLAIKAEVLLTAIGRDSEYNWTYAANGKRLAEQVQAVLGGVING